MRTRPDHMAAGLALIIAAIAIAIILAFNAGHWLGENAVAFAVGGKL